MRISAGVHASSLLLSHSAVRLSSSSYERLRFSSSFPQTWAGFVTGFGQRNAAVEVTESRPQDIWCISGFSLGTLLNC